MSLFDSILANLKQKIDETSAYKKIVIEGVRSIVGVTLSEDMIISFKEGILKLSVPATIKAAIILKQEKLLSELSVHGLTVHTIR